MEAFRTLIRGVLPPSGNPIVVDEAEASLSGLFSDYETRWLDSGTSALAAALLEAKNRHRSVTRPKVIIPAYCCPDLVSAAVYAGVEPIIVDLAESDSRYDLEKLSNAINASTIAIIAVNFMGIRENLEAIQAITLNHQHCSLIEDNAQWFPGLTERAQLKADFTIFSFGRGKPVSLLGGGLLVGKNLTAVSLPRGAAGSARSADRGTVSEHGRGIGHTPGRSSTLVKYFLYNRLLHPVLYQLIDRNPLLSVGETRYKELTDIDSLDELRCNIIEANIEQYDKLDRSCERFYLTALQNHNQLRSMNIGAQGRLLRYPLLVPTQDDQLELYERLKREGLGVTKLYQKALPQIQGLPEGWNCPFPINHAESFSKRLLTLPLHQGVKQDHISRTLNVISHYFS